MKFKKNCAKQIIILLSLFLNTHVFAQKDIVAKTPPMGWNSWNKFWKSTDEKLVKEIADAMVNSGMKDAGYEYVVIDDLWQQGRVKGDSVIIEGRDINNELIPDPDKFPNGMRAIGDYIHSKGLKFGLYTGPGPRTCGGAPGSLGFEEIDVATFDRWGVDFIKLDKCSFSGDINEMLLKWRGLLDKASRPIVLSVNMGQYNNPAEVYATTNMWRTTSDIRAIWSYAPDEFRIFPSITDVIEQHDRISVAQSPTAWNDPDMMQVGNGQLTLDENKSHFNMWAIFGAPLMAGNDLRNMSPDIISLLTNKEIIEINQDALGFRGIKVKDNGKGNEIWVKKLYKYSDYVVVLLNVSENEASVQFNKKDIGVTGDFFVRDLDAHKDLGYYEESLTLPVPPHGSRILKISANEFPVNLTPVNPIQVFDGEFFTEAEEVIGFESCSYGSQINGFSGSGYLKGELHKWGRVRLIWKVIANKKEECELIIRYSSLSKEDAVYSVRNSKTELPFKTITLPKTKKNKWKIVSVPVLLEQGENIFMLRSGSGASNEVGIDYIKINSKKE